LCISSRKKLTEKIQNSESKNANIKNSQITKLTKYLIKENMPIIAVQIKKATIKNIKVPIKNLMRNAWAHSSHAHQEDIKGQSPVQKLSVPAPLIKSTAPGFRLLQGPEQNYTATSHCHPTGS